MNYEAIVVLGRGIGKDSNGRWRPTPSFAEGSLHSAVYSNMVDPNDQTQEILFGGGNANCLAVYHLYRQLVEQGDAPKLVIFAAGRPNYLSGEIASLSEGSVMSKNVLRRIDRVGLNPPEIVILDKNKNTHDDIGESMGVVTARGLNRVVIITAEVHSARAEEFYNRVAAEGLPEGLSVEFRPAEDILKSVGDRYRRVLSNLKETGGYKRTAFLEDRGLKALLDGTYDIRSQGFGFAKEII